MNLLMLIEDTQLSMFANFMGVTIFMLIILYHYLS